MGRERGEQTSPDLFSTGPVPDSRPPPPKAPAASATQPQRHVLPKNLPAAVKYLSDGELDVLYAATIEEIKRRGRLPPGVSAVSAQSSEPTNMRRTDKVPQQSDADASLTQGQVNAVRAAFKAGITPARIARQFGLSQSNVRKALATGAPRR